MKSLKLDHDLAQAVIAGTKTSTIRLFDDKDLSVGDAVELIDKIDANNRDSWIAIGVATVTEVISKDLGEITVNDLQGHHLYESISEMLEDFKRYYGQNVSLAAPAKIITFTFVAHGDEPHHAQIALNPAAPLYEVKLFTDGGSRGNPGPSASGFVLLDLNDNVVKKSGIYLGVTTNNQAEYQALKFGLQEAHKMGAREVQVFMDSMLVVNQMKGIFKVKNRDLWPIHDDIKDLIATFKKVEFQHVPRELNKLADYEVNETLDANTNKSGV